MGILSSILMGILQGLTEFLPISSSGHLKLAHLIFGTEIGNSSFDIFLHLGSLVAVLIYFRKTLLDLIVSLFRWRKSLDNQVHFHNRLMILYLIVATFTTGIFYLIFKDFLDRLFDHPNPLAIALTLSITGVLIFLSDKVKDCRIPASTMGIMRSIIIGLAQGIAIIPGISRSGSTIAVSLFTGIKREDAAHFSFLLSIPAILGANLAELSTLGNLQTGLLAEYILGFIFAALSGYLVISMLISFIRMSKLKYFAYYCWGIALITTLIVVI